ncbi:N-acyl-D-amino-acid deacylase family protein [Neptunicella marina]|uniref:Amidohydrolase family protein n=1 Tax=Neptunicella marina TaxID=2125989 RepID=A0A8J6ISI1_9ALTE|nr:amidohydrolase family protein [Neptunicella marina]MBC3764593.1 amidohydrolase family protein [Neptunicella marina]
MTTSCRRFYQFFLAVSLLLAGFAARASVVDVLFTHARVIDGSGRPAFIGDVAVTGGQVSFVGDAAKHNIIATQTIDAAGKYLTPGFIDLHAHGNPVKDGAFTNFISMGVTSVVLGQDGFSPAISGIQSWQQQWDPQGVAVNIGMLVGHGSLRRYVGIGNVSNVSEKQISAMESVLNNALDTHFGLSTGLEYVPAIHAPESELIALAKIVGKKHRLIMSHMRSEDDDKLFTSIHELARQGKFAKVHISHIKSVYGQGAERGKDIVALLEQYNNERIHITADIYPYTASYTGLAILFPQWAKTDGMMQRAVQTRRKELEQYLLNKVLSRGGPGSTLMGTGKYKGRTLEEVATLLEKPFQDVLIDDLGPEGASAAYFIMDDALQEELLKSRLVAIGSDGSPTMYHPRGYGSFAKVLQQYVKQQGLLTIEKAIYKMTGLAAQIIGLPKRGLIREGYSADLLLFDLNQIKSHADYQHPHQLATGFEWVMVNGKFAIEQGNVNLNRQGQLLLPASYNQEH